MRAVIMALVAVVSASCVSNMADTDKSRQQDMLVFSMADTDESRQQDMLVFSMADTDESRQQDMLVSSMADTDESRQQDVLGEIGDCDDAASDGSQSTSYGGVATCGTIDTPPCWDDPLIQQL